ncbi:hypothetical protein GCM10027345_25690 [Hymenobacter daeguensis]
MSKVIADASGNVYVTGLFTGTLTLGPTTLVSAGGNDVFVAKWSEASNGFLWAQRAGGTGDDQPYALALNGASVYVTGSFNGTAAFGSTTLTSAGAADVFVAKLTDAGSSSRFVWSQGGGSLLDDYCGGLAVAGSNVYVTGYFYGLTAQYGPFSLASSGGNMFVFKLTDNGPSASFSWIQQASNAYSSAIAVSGANVYLAGSRSPNTAAIFGPVSLYTPSLASAPSNMFLVKLVDNGSTGTFVWGKAIMGTGSTSTSALVANGATVYMAGHFVSSIDLGNNIGLYAMGGNRQVLIAKLTDVGSSGTFVWAYTAGGFSGAIASALAINGTDLYMAGNFTGPSTATFGNTVLTSYGGYDAFMSKLTDNGSGATFAWTKQAGGTGSDYATGIALTGTSVYVAGNAQPTANFDVQSITSPVGGSVGFLASLGNRPLAVASSTMLVGLELFPNPAHGRVTVQLPATPGTTTASLTVLDALGRTLRTQTAATNATAELDLTRLAPGLYAVRVQAGGATATQRLVVE